MRIGIPSDHSQPLVVADTRIVGVLIQNVSGVDVFMAEDQGLLDSSVNPQTNLPATGIVLAANGPPLVIPRFFGKLFGRAQNPAQVELQVFSVEVPCCT